MITHIKLGLGLAGTIHKFSWRRSVLLVMGIALGLSSARADIKLPAIFGDHMVLQQEAKIPVWGWAEPGEKVTVTFGKNKAEATAGSDGKWRADLPAVKAGTPPGSLVVAGKNTVTLNDVLVGDVWVCSGQSNMAMPLVGALGSTKEISGPMDSQLRLFQVLPQLGIVPCDDVQGTWRVCDPVKMGTFSAVGYYFAKNLRPVLNRPIGLIESVWGGTPAQAWTDFPTLQANPILQHYATDYKTGAALYPGGQADLEAKAEPVKQWEAQVRADPAYQAADKAWHTAIVQAKAAGQPEPPQPPPPIPRPAGLKVGSGTPAILFNGMIHPLIPYAIKGAIWYQGESNTGHPVEYATLFPAMITDWRTLWGQGDFPFLFVQLANYLKPPIAAGDGSNWALLRESQLKTLSLPQTGMAVIVDIGTGGNIHPPDKADVGMRLAQAARHVAYGEKVVYTGPIYHSMKVAGDKISLTFNEDSVGGGLVIGSAPWIDPRAIPVSKTELQGFAIAGADKNWVWANAKIEGDTVIVSSPQVKSPVAVRYAWADNPTCNLYNKEGLPASPFRTDEWDGAPAHLHVSAPPTPADK